MRGINSNVNGRSKKSGATMNCRSRNGGVNTHLGNRSRIHVNLETTAKFRHRLRTVD